MCSGEQAFQNSVRRKSSVILERKRPCVLCILEKVLFSVSLFASFCGLSFEKFDREHCVMATTEVNGVKNLEFPK